MKELQPNTIEYEITKLLKIHKYPKLMKKKLNS